MKGRLIAQCCACGLPKGDRDKNEGWWIVMPRGRPLEARDYCSACAIALFVRSDEIQSNPRSMSGLRIVALEWLRGTIYALAIAGPTSTKARSSLGWPLAEKVAALIGFKGFPKALQTREFGRIPGEMP